MLVKPRKRRSMEVRQKSFWLDDAHRDPLPLDRPVVVDGFAGGGGASWGIQMALGRGPDVAINHDRDAIAMHMANHPDTRHYCENIYDVSPDEVCEGRVIGAAWFSPDCTHFSRARGAKPVKKEIRGLAGAIIPWAEMDRRYRPRVIFVENVSEFQTWGPIDEQTNQPIKERAGEYFREWVQQLRDLGYEVDWRELVASDYGAPTTRKRLFIIARCDGRSIVWPAPTHGSPAKVAKHPQLQTWRTAAEIIDWSIPCPSIFLTKEEAKREGCIRPLADKTLARIAEGIRRYVIETSSPFIVRVNHGSDHWRGQPLASTANQGTTGRAPYCWDAQEPVRTLTTTGDKVVVAPMLSRMFGASVGSAIDSPVGTATAKNKTALVAAFIAKHYGGVTGVPAETPFPTITAVGTQNQLVAATLIKNNHGDKQAFDVDEPLRTVMAGANHHAVVQARMQQVRAFLFRYFGSGGQWSSCESPTPTITAKDRLALGIVLVDGEPFQIIDIGMRMLTPRELFSAQGFPSTYVIDRGEDGRPLTKSAQVARCGNSVPPPFAEALVRANCPEMCARRER